MKRIAIALLVVVAAGFFSATLPGGGVAPAHAQLFDAAAEGRKEHPKILRQFGGAYHDPKVRNYVSAIGNRLLARTPMAGQKFTFTVLNSDIVNAFALPGGFVYVTRGLLALADSEAELAGVLAHEIGHVTSRHGEKRMTNTLLAQLGLGLLGAVFDSQMVNTVAQLGALTVLQSYSREQEYEADLAGVRNMTATGYDPAYMARFLSKLEDERKLRARVAGQKEDAGDQFNLLATHPRTADRVNRAIRAASKQGRPPGQPRVGVADYMRIIDGMYYDGDPDNGFIKGRRFVHPKLRFAFRVPPGFTVLNAADAVTAIGPEKAQIAFDLHQRPAGASMVQYLRDVWAQKIRLSDLEAIVINGHAAATGAARLNDRQGARDVRLVAIAFEGQQVARFLFVTPPGVTAKTRTEFQRTTYSYRRLSPRAARGEWPLRLRTTRVKKGQTVETFARRMPFPSHRTERFRVLNGLAPTQKLKPGWWVKFVSE